MKTAPETWKSLLFVPTTRRDFVAKAHTLGADVVQLDLEDSIALSEKQQARQLLKDEIEELVQHDATVAVRINRPWRMAIRDMEAAVLRGVSALALPKVESADHVVACAEIVGELEEERNIPSGSIDFIIMVETAKGMTRIKEIAAAHPRVAAITLGGEDFATDVGIEPDPEILKSYKQQLVVAARAAGVVPLGLLGTIAQYRDTDAFAETVARSRRLGFVGASAIHPLQVPILNAGFSPNPDEVDRAARLVTAYRDANRSGVGAIEVDGMMVDEPIARRAEQLLRRAGRASVG